MSEITLTEGAAPNTPATGKVSIYPKTDKKIYAKVDSGVETRLSENQVNGLSAHIETPSNKTFSLMFNATTGGTVDSLYYQLASGTCTLDIKINGVVVTGLGSLAANTTKKTANATALNTYVAGDEISLTMSAVSAAADLKLTLQTTDA